MVYYNQYGEEEDASRLLSPSFTAISQSMKVEFYYYIRQSTLRDLTLSVLKADVTGRFYEESTVWESRYLRRGEEDMWLYGCADFVNDAVAEQCVYSN